MDNDLLTLWLNAGDLDRDAVRTLIEQLQAGREETCRRDAFLTEVLERLTRICETFDRLRDQLADHQEEIDILAGDLDGRAAGEE